MQRLFYAIAFSFTLASLGAQTLVKQYVTIEHFTNSRCGICASRNPGFYTTIGPNASDVHHLSIHPSVPYSNCVFYQANTTDNSALATHYGINGTPRVALNGTLVNAGNPLLPLATLQAQLNLTSPLHVGVTESGSGAQRTATVTLTTVGDIPAGNYQLMVAAVEKTINQTTPNGESVHRDVLRDLLTNPQGDAVTLPAVGQQTTLTFPYSIAGAWNADEMYVLAWVRNAGTKAILNSGNRFDPVFVSTSAPETTAVNAWPNPAANEAWVQTNAETILSAELIGMDGRTHKAAFSPDADRTRIDVSSLPAGLYFVRLRSAQQSFAGKLVVASR